MGCLILAWLFITIWQCQTKEVGYITEERRKDDAVGDVHRGIIPDAFLIVCFWFLLNMVVKTADFNQPSPPFQEE